MENFEKCLNCLHSDFLDYNKVNCSKGITMIDNCDCEQFEENEIKEEPKFELLSGKLNDIMDEEKEKFITIEKKKQENNSIIKLSTVNNNLDNQLDRRIYTKKTVQVFSDSSLYTQIETIPQNQLLKFQREVIRKRKQLLFYKKNETKHFIPNDLSLFSICEHCIVIGTSVDIILMSHTEFDLYISDVESDNHKIEDKFKKDIDSLIEYIGGKTKVRIINRIIRGGNDISLFNALLFNNELKSIQLARLYSQTHFFISDITKYKNVKKIVTNDGVEGILVCSDESYKVVSDSLWSVIKFITIGAAIIFSIYIIITVLSETGYFVFWSFGLIILCFLSIYIIGMPIYKILNRLGKYL